MFISYTAADRAWAEWIAWQLEQVGHTTVLQAWDFAPGSNFVVEMHRAAEKAARTIAVLSPAYLQSAYATTEWAAAFAADPLGAKRKLLPIRVEACSPSGLLAQIVYVDLVAAVGSRLGRRCWPAPPASARARSRAFLPRPGCARRWPSPAYL